MIQPVTHGSGLPFTVGLDEIAEEIRDGLVNGVCALPPPVSDAWIARIVGLQIIFRTLRKICFWTPLGPNALRARGIFQKIP
jgi:hypothetical protein